MMIPVLKVLKLNPKNCTDSVQVIRQFLDDPNAYLVQSFCEKILKKYLDHFKQLVEKNEGSSLFMMRSHSSPLCICSDVSLLSQELLAICDVVKKINVGKADRTLKQIQSVLSLKSPVRGTFPNRRNSYTHLPSH